jgi:hypothetical protein
VVSHIPPLSLFLYSEVTSQSGVSVKPEMDNCTGAAGPRPINEVFSPGQTATMTVDDVNGGFCGVEINTPGIWWYVEGTGAILRAATCDERTEIKTKISVFTGSCDALRCVEGTASPHFECPIVQRKESGEWDTISTAVDFQTNVGQAYYILVQEGANTGPGAVWMNFATPLYPRNNECIDAIGPLPRDNTLITGTTTNSAISNVPEGYCGAPALYPGVWYQFFGTGGDVVISACGAFNVNGIYFSVYSGGSCDDKKCAQGSYTGLDVIDAARCSFGAARIPRPMTQYTVPNTRDRDRYYVYVHWGRTVGDKPTGDFRLFVSDGNGGKGGTGGAAAIKFAPPGSTNDGGDDDDGGSNEGSIDGNDSNDDNNNNNKKSGAATSLKYAWVMGGVVSASLSLWL